MAQALIPKWKIERFNPFYDGTGKGCWTLVGVYGVNDIIRMKKLCLEKYGQRNIDVCFLD